MSATMADQLIDRSMNDEAFLARLRSEPEAIVEEYDLDDDFAQAVVTGDEERAHEVFKMDNTIVVVVVF